MATRQGARTLSKQGTRTISKPRKSPVNWVIVGIIVVLTVGGFAFWLGQKDTVRLTSEDRALAPIAEKMMRGEPLSPAEQKTWREMQAAAAENFLKQDGKSVAPVVPTTLPAAPVASGIVPPVKDTWKVGTTTVIYREAASAKGKIKVWVEFTNDSQQRNLIMVQNLLDKPIEFKPFGRLDDGQVITGESSSFEPKQKDTWAVVGNLNAKKVELWVEIKAN
jgi:hypothetical protein